MYKETSSLLLTSVSLKMSLLLLLGHFFPCYPIGTQISPLASGSGVQWVCKYNPSYSSVFCVHFCFWLSEMFISVFGMVILFKFFFLMSYSVSVSYCCIIQYPLKSEWFTTSHVLTFMYLGFTWGLANLGWVLLGNSASLCRKWDGGIKILASLSSCYLVSCLCPLLLPHSLPISQVQL